MVSYVASNQERTLKSKQLRSEHTRSKIIRATARVISSRGLSAATLEQITLESGITTGAVYFHFKNRDAVINEVSEVASDLFEKLIRNAIDPETDEMGNVIRVSATLARKIAIDPIMQAGCRLLITGEHIHSVDLAKAAKVAISSVSSKQNCVDNQTWNSFLQLFAGILTTHSVMNNWRKIPESLELSWLTWLSTSYEPSDISKYSKLTKTCFANKELAFLDFNNSSQLQTSFQSPM